MWIAWIIWITFLTFHQSWNMESLHTTGNSLVNLLAQICLCHVFATFIHSCRIEKDSSNDEDMFGDSSQEGSQAALDIFPFDPLSVALPLDECPAEEAPTILPTIETDTVPLQDTLGTQETACSMLTADEDCIRKINEEETKFYENYVSCECFLIVNIIQVI